MGDSYLFFVRILGRFRRLRTKYGKKYSKQRRALKVWYKNNKDDLKNRAWGLIIWCKDASLYGLVLNVPAAWVFGWPLTVKTFIGWSLIGYMLSTEVPVAVRKSKRL